MNESLKRSKTMVRNGYGVETTPQYLAEVFPIHDAVERAKILNHMDEAESFDGENLRETAGNISLRGRLEAMHQALLKAGR